MFQAGEKLCEAGEPALAKLAELLAHRVANASWNTDCDQMKRVLGHLSTESRWLVFQQLQLLDGGAWTKLPLELQHVCFCL